MTENFSNNCLSLLWSYAQNSQGSLQLVLRKIDRSDQRAFGHLAKVKRSFS